jgi:hypothetical protein
LRGYPSRYVFGSNLLAANVEYRSRPIEIASLQFGAAAFYDSGDAFGSFDHIRPKHAVGGGLRVVLPQIERSVFRLDVGFPVGASDLPSTVAPFSIFFAFSQALALPQPSPPDEGFASEAPPSY